MGTVAPEGSGWARELSALARYVEAEAKGALRVKLYFDGVAGDELEMGERMQQGAARRRRLGPVPLPGGSRRRCACCASPGVFQSRDEARDVVDPPAADHRARRRRSNGFVHARRRRPRARRVLHARAGALARGRAPPQAVALGRRRGRHRRLARDGPARSCRSDLRGAPRLRRQAHRRLHRRAVGGAGLPVVVGGAAT